VVLQAQTIAPVNAAQRTTVGSEEGPLHQNHQKEKTSASQQFFVPQPQKYHAEKCIAQV
jgi:hypothetical protein